jgi:DNA-3-methyladenine glycosylase II
VNEHEIAVVAPYRLDLTVSALRRLSTNVVDLFTGDGEYLRVLPGFRRGVIARVRQPRPNLLAVRFERAAAHDHRRALAMIRRILGVDRDVSQFERIAKRLPVLAGLATRMRGVRPPRYPTLWEACVNAVLFQQVSLRAASAIMHRFIVTLSRSRGGPPVEFPAADRLRRAGDDVVRAAGVSQNKLVALRGVADALHSGALDEPTLEALPSVEAAAVLRRLAGIGPWTATVILLRGLGRLDVFPASDSSVAHNLAFVAGGATIRLDELLAALGSQRGMLYYYLLLARLEARGDLGRESSAFAEIRATQSAQARSCR